ncbi:hypothetical protein AGMMS50225_20710 [Betaproteobacteria bacterium]|nr:hypothetical protein AGMMS50225_20710 [Betaproteobacteria bacterium]
MMAPRLLSLLCATTLAAACSILPEPRPIDIWLLPAAAHTTTPAPEPRPWSLRLARPAVAGHLATQRIVVVPAPDQISVYKGANWNEPAPLLLRNRLLDAFRADGRIAALSTDEQRVFADFELVSDLRAFQSEYRAAHEPPEILIRLDARLLDSANRRIVASQRFEARVRAGDERVAEVVKAFGNAADALSDALVSWVVGAGDR